MEKLLNEKVFGIGDLIKAYDFEPIPGRGDCFIEGVIYDVVNHPVHGARMFRVRVTREVWGGEDMPRGEGKVFSRMYVPVETSNEFSGRIQFVSDKF